MSHFATYKANVTSKKYLLRALKEMGYETVLDTTIRDYFGQTQKVQVAVHEQPIGFLWNEDEKKYDVVADWWGTKVRENEFCNKVSQLHEKHKVKSICKSKGLKAGNWKTLEDGSLQMVATQTVY